MQIRKALAACALLLSGALTASQASAQFFVGGSIGQSDIDDEITTGLITSGTVDGKDTAWKIFGGYMFNRHFGVEAAGPGTARGSPSFLRRRGETCITPSSRPV